MLGSGLRIGEEVWFQWRNVDFERGLVRINEFATVINHEVVASVGKSRDAIRTVDIDEHLAQVLRQQRKTQASEQLPSADYEAEYGACREYLPDELAVEAAALEGLSAGRGRPGLADLIRRRVVLELPAGYC